MASLDTAAEQLTPVELGAWRGLLRVHAALVKSLDAELSAAHELPLSSYEVLITLEAAPGRKLRMSELADSVLLSRSGTTRLHDLQGRASEGSLLELAEAIANQMPARSVSFATENIVFPLQSTGRRVVSIPRPEPAAPSLEQRQQATDKFFAAGTDNSERRRLIRQWGATHVVFSDGDLDPRVVADLRALGAVSRFPRGIELVTIDGSPPAFAEPGR